MNTINLVDSVKLRSRVGTVRFTRRTLLKHETGNTYLAPVEYVFDPTNGFTAEVGRDVWEDLEHEYLDRTAGLRYCDALKPV